MIFFVFIEYFGDLLFLLTSRGGSFFPLFRSRLEAKICGFPFLCIANCNIFAEKH